MNEEDKINDAIAEIVDTDSSEIIVSSNEENLNKAMKSFNSSPEYEDTKKLLDAVGCGFCLAKWTQVTMHLQLGHTHSCHHPQTHKIPIAEIRRNPSALHNTRFKKRKRKEMLEGKRPEECGYCWNIEDNSNRFSDRVFKSNEPWSHPYLEEIKNSHWRDNFNPRYVEVSFSNACNFKCSYCAPQFSSTWMEEINKLGGYPTTDEFNDRRHLVEFNTVPIPHKDSNPYVDAFWEWWPDLYNDLHTFRITGGEPMLSKDTWKVLDYILEQENPNRNLQLAINSNLGGPDKLIDKFIDKISQIEDEDRVKELVIFTSVDTWGEQAEYIRNGLEFNRFWDNVNKLMEKCPRVVTTFMVTYNALSVPNYHKLIDGVYDLKNQYGSADRYWNSAVFMDTSYLRFPAHQTAQILPSSFDDLVLNQARRMDYLGVPVFAHKYIGYSDVEIQKIKRLYDWMQSREEGKELNESRYNFGKMFEEHDKRRGTDFKKTFPELADFFEKCKEIKL